MGEEGEREGGAGERDGKTTIKCLSVHAVCIKVNCITRNIMAQSMHDRSVTNIVTMV